MTRFAWIAVVAALVAVSPASFVARVAAEVVDGQAMILPVDPNPLLVETAAGERRFTIEIADEDHERTAGLMFRTRMDDDHGMLFVFERTRRLAFWMKNTPMPLDLIFVGEDGHVVAVMQGEPFSTASISPAAPARFVLELKAGTAQMTGIADGDRMRHPRIDADADAP